MTRSIRVSGIVAFAGAIVLAVWAARSPSTKRSSRVRLAETVQSVVTNPVAFAKNHFTGGLGVLLASDPATGLPRVEQIGISSPAEKAGLRIGDLITQLDGITTAGRPGSQVLEAIRGFTGTKVTLTVQRGGSTNIQCVIYRGSWSTLRGLSYQPPNPYE